MNNKLYDVLKWVAILLIPALSTLVSVLGKIWGWPWADSVAQTITALGVFLGAVLGISSVNYKKIEDALKGSDAE